MIEAGWMTVVLIWVVGCGLGAAIAFAGGCQLRRQRQRAAWTPATTRAPGAAGSRMVRHLAAERLRRLSEEQR